MSDMNSGNQFDHPKTLQTIEVMEYLASAMTWNQGRELIFSELKDDENQSPDGLPFYCGDDLRLLREDLYEELISVFHDTIRMKELLFQVLQLTPISKPVEGCATMCHQCNWIFTHCDMQLNGW